MFDNVRVDGLVMQGTRASAAIVVTLFFWNIPVSALEGLAGRYRYMA